LFASTWDAHVSLSANALTFHAEHPQPVGKKPTRQPAARTQTPPKIDHTEPTPPHTPTEKAESIDPKQPNLSNHEEDSIPPEEKPKEKPKEKTNKERGDALQAAAEKIVGSTHNSRPQLARGTSNEDAKKGLKPGAANKKDGRRSSWIASFSSKFSSSNSPQTSRNSSFDSTSHANGSGGSPQPSPKIELTNPFYKTQPVKDGQKETKKEENKTAPVVYTPRRQSVLVAAGKETKLDHPGFLSSALRRLSSSTNATMGKGTNSGALCPRKVMNIDQNRERIKIGEFDQNKLKRVAFCVDVEIAGFASQADEELEQPNRPPVSSAQKQTHGTPEKQATGGKDSKDARMKDKGEGAALKNPTAASEEKEELGQTKIDTQIEADEGADATPDNNNHPSPDPPAPAPGTRKKEKKKRSEAERKERKERKRKHAEANGLVPLELTREDSNSDSSPSNTPEGSSTPRRSDGPTTDPLRIYKRCCQLRETTVLSRMKEQISKPSATLAEAPGTVAVMDLTGMQFQLQDIVTLGDWLAVVPVRKLILDGCGLTDEGVRVVLSGLSGCKSAEQARQNRKLPKRLSGKKGTEQMGMIERLSLTNNPNITNLGWKHIGLFMHMSKSLKAIDLSGIPFPKNGDLSRTSSTASSTSNNSTDPAPKSMDVGALIIRALAQRLGDKLEELVLSDCGLSTANVRDIVDCAIKVKIRRLGLAENNLNEESLGHVARYIKSGVCEGLDLGGNDLHDIGQIVADAPVADNPLFAISLSNCNLDPRDLSTILSSFSKLSNLKFIDLSRNKGMFDSKPDAVAILRKLLPRLKPLRRIHLNDVGMTPDQAIALAEILPDCPSMAHLAILENEPLVSAMNSKKGSAQEEACAVFASLMTAVRVSETIVAIEIEVPSVESSEVVKALASQVVAYSLRNMEHTTLDEVGVKSAGNANTDAPEVLLQLVGHMDGYSSNHDQDEPAAPDEDYMIASTGIVKALGICLGSKDNNSRSHSRNITPTASGTATPRQGARRKDMSKPRDVSLELCESARKIRMRLRPVLVREDQAGNDENYRKFRNCPPIVMFLLH